MKVAEQSPRICEDGSIRWYYGDTFKIILEVKIVDDYGQEIPIAATDKFTVDFYNYRSEVVQTFEAIGSNEVELDFTQATSNKFTEGVYTFTTIYNGTRVATVIKNNKVVVE